MGKVGHGQEQIFERGKSRSWTGAEAQTWESRSWIGADLQNGGK